MDSQRIAEEARRIKQEAATRSPAEQAEVESVAAGLEHEATAEVAETEGEPGRARRATRISHVVDCVLFVIYGLIALEIALDLFGARRASVFKRRSVLGPSEDGMRAEGLLHGVPQRRNRG